MANLDGYPASVIGQIIKSMTADQIVDALNNGLFEMDTAKFVTPKQISEIDFTKVTFQNAVDQKAMTDEYKKDVVSALFRNDEMFQRLRIKRALIILSNLFIQRGLLI